MNLKVRTAFLKEMKKAGCKNPRVLELLTYADDDRLQDVDANKLSEAELDQLHAMLAARKAGGK